MERRIDTNVCTYIYIYTIVGKYHKDMLKYNIHKTKFKVSCSQSREWKQLFSLAHHVECFKKTFESLKLRMKNIHVHSFASLAVSI